ncbi:TPA: hypothetical protein ACIOW1_001497 [Streptococcus agalactiae]
MKQETLVLLPNFIGDAIYEGFEAGPAQLNGKKGSYTRHILFNEKHGKFSSNVILFSFIVFKR